MIQAFSILLYLIKKSQLFFWISLVIQTKMIARFFTPYVKSLQINILISQQKIQNGLNH